MIADLLVYLSEPTLYGGAVIGALMRPTFKALAVVANALTILSSVVSGFVALKNIVLWVRKKWKGRSSKKQLKGLTADDVTQSD